MASLRSALDTAMFNALNVAGVLAAAPGGVYNTVAPAGAAPPYVVFQAVTKVDDYSFGARYAQATYQVIAVSRNPWPKEAADIDDDIDTALQDVALSITGYTALRCRRENDIYFQEEVGGVLYHKIGGGYRIWADEA